MPRRALAALVLLAAGAAAAGEPPPGRQAELVGLLRQDCGSCHGMTLKGGLGPPLLPAALAGKDVDALVAIVLDGVPGKPMPPWRPELSEEEARWLVSKLLEGLP